MLSTASDFLLNDLYYKVLPTEMKLISLTLFAALASSLVDAFVHISSAALRNSGQSTPVRLFQTASSSESSSGSPPDSDGSYSVKMHLPRVEFEYCTGCRWLLRSAWMAQEVLTTFEKSVGEVCLIPCKSDSGVFIVRVNGQVIWDRKDPETKGFPEMKEIKQRIRDKINPDLSLGHSDKTRQQQ